jgi:type IV pilus assembly protein PilA
MLARIRKAQEKRDAGFTLIELLVVMIIIGILAAIAIPVFLNQRKKARETSAKADVSTIGKEMAAYYVDGTAATSVTYSGNVWTFAVTAGPVPITSGTLSAGNTVLPTKSIGTTAGVYCAAVQTSDSVAWHYSNSTTSPTGLVAGDCP